MYFRRERRSGGEPFDEFCNFAYGSPVSGVFSANNQDVPVQQTNPSSNEADTMDVVDADADTTMEVGADADTTMEITTVPVTPLNTSVIPSPQVAGPSRNTLKRLIGEDERMGTNAYVEALTECGKRFCQRREYDDDPDKTPQDQDDGQGINFDWDEL